MATDYAETMSAYLSLFAVSFLAATFVPFYSEFAVVGMLALDANRELVLATATLGNTLGAAVNWLLGRFLLHYQNRRWFPVTRDQLARAQAWYQRWGVWSLLMAWLPIGGDALTFVAGIMRVRFDLFFVLHGYNCAGTMKIGVQLPEVEREVRWSELAAMATLAEDVGFDSLWVGDHLLYRNPGEAARGPWEAWSQMAALAAITRRVEIGPLVAATSFHSPAMLAKKAATVDEISGGRLILGLGAGWNRVEYEAFGFAYDNRVSRFEEAFTIIRTLLRDGAVDFDGDYYQLRDCELEPRGPRPQGPPLMVGSMGPRMLRITMPHVDAWNAWHAWYGNRVDGLPEVLAKVDEACTDVGRDPASLLRTTTVLVQLPGGTGRASGDSDKRGVTPLQGSADAIAESLRAYAGLGIGHLQLVLDPITAQSIERLAPVLERLSVDDK